MITFLKGSLHGFQFPEKLACYRLTLRGKPNPGIHKLKCLIRICYTANARSVWYGLLVRIRNLLILSKRVSNFFATVRSFFFWISVSVYDFYRALSSWFSYVMRFCMVYTVVYIVRNILFFLGILMSSFVWGYSSCALKCPAVVPFCILFSEY